MLYDTKWDAEVIAPWRKALFDAAAYIERHGWCQRELELADGAVCIMGALNKVAHTAGGPTAWLDALRQIERHIGSEYVVPWNDAPGRTKEEVVGALRDAAVRDVP